MQDFTIIKNIRIITGIDDRTIENGAMIIMNRDRIEEDRILYCGSALKNDSTYLKLLPPGTSENDITVMDLSEGCFTLLPGLINTHVHLDLDLPYLSYKADPWGDAYRTLVVYRRAAEALMCGVTALRGVGIVGECELAVRKAFENGMLFGPRIISCGSPLSPTGGHGWLVPGTIVCDGKDEFIRGVRSQIAQGADQIKLLYTGGLAGAYEGTYDIQMTAEEIAACLEVAHRNGKKVTAHLSNDRAIREAVELGIDCVEHAYSLSEVTAARMAEKGVYYSATLCVSHSNDYMRRLGVPDYTLKKQEEAAKGHLESCRRAAAAGVKICTGTDLLPSDPIDGTNATVREAELLVEDAGLSPMEAIMAATRNGAELLGIDDVTGTLEAGKSGDFIIVEGKPDEKIRDLRNLRLVSRGCRLVWSSLPVMDRNNYRITAPGIELGGGVFKKW